MPRAFKRICTYPGCTTLADGPRCEAHPHQWSRETYTRRQITGRALQRERAALFAADPLCALCKQSGRATLADVRDHIVPLAQGGEDERSNTQGLCHACHDAKSQAEAQAGRAKRGRPRVGGDGRSFGFA